jgi:hypothetical protein
MGEFGTWAPETRTWGFCLKRGSRDPDMRISGHGLPRPEYMVTTGPKTHNYNNKNTSRPQTRYLKHTMKIEEFSAPNAGKKKKNDKKMKRQ